MASNGSVAFCASAPSIAINRRPPCIFALCSPIVNAPSPTRAQPKPTSHKAHAQVRHGDSTDGDALNRLPALCAKFWADFESELVRMDSEDHHIHLLVNYPPKVAVSHLVNRSRACPAECLTAET
jgi:Transposase IS200 like